MTAHLTIWFQVYTIKQEKRGLCPYDDKRYLLVDLPDGHPNPNTHAYGHCGLAALSNWWPTSQSLVRSSSFGIPRSDSLGDTPA